MEKYSILIAIKDTLIREIYTAVFSANKFEVFETGDSKNFLEIAKSKNPDIILVDVSLSPLDGFGVLKKIKNDPSTQKIPVVIFSQMEREEDRRKAIEFDAKDFIIGNITTPLEAVLKIKVHLGEQKTYQIRIDKDLEKIQELANDLGYKSLNCPICGSSLELFLIRDLLRGKDYFKVSFICPKCLKR
jgi:two-component system alkaline phosphatase synthesis response regulator PhoP